MNANTKLQRRAERQNKREDILYSAIEVFAQKGSNLATIADVAKRARVAPGTVYLYFNSKDDLLQKCMSEVISSEINNIIELTSGIPDPMERLYAFFFHHTELVESKPFIARFITVELRQTELFNRRNPGYNPIQIYLNFVVEQTTLAIKSGRIRDINPQAFALLLVGAMDIIIWQWLASNTPIDLRKISEQIRSILQRGVSMETEV